LTADEETDAVVLISKKASTPASHDNKAELCIMILTYSVLMTSLV